MVFMCVVPGCTNRESNFKYYSVPFTNKTRWEMWLKSCPFLNQYPASKLEQIRICCKHFLPEDINENLRLNPSAVPVLNLNLVTQPDLSPITHNITQAPSTSTTIVLSDKLNSQVKFQSCKRNKQNRIECTPRKPIISTHTNSLKNKVCSLYLENLELMIKINANAPKTKMILKKYNVLSKYRKLLVNAQLCLTESSSKSCRYTNEEKILALSLFNLSPQCYRFLRTYLSLPCKSRINSFVNNMSLKTGINDFIFQHLANSAIDKPAIDRQCTLMFDEMAIRKNLNFVDSGSGTHTNKVADKVLVFMLRGLFSSWNIPIAFYFTGDGVKTLDLKNIIKELVLAVFKSGFVIRATISDQGSANVAAIKSLILDSNAEILHNKSGSTSDIYYNVGVNKLYHIYNAPNLLKCFRNDFQKNNLLIGEQRAKWVYIEYFHKRHCYGIISRSLNLTRRHLNPTLYDRTKVRFAAQVFSRQLAFLMEIQMKSLLYQQVTYAGLNINTDEGFFTAEIIRFINDLFDSLNGFRRFGTTLKHGLSHNSEHIAFWNDAVKKLSSMSFDSSDRRKAKPLSLKLFVHDIITITQLWSDLLGIDGVKFLNLRHLNQEPLESFFQQVKACGNFSANPHRNHFVSAFKTSLINNISTV